MRKNSICAVITGEDSAAIEQAAKDADIFEVRIDLIGSSWPDIVRKLKKPWIATNRNKAQHGQWDGSEEQRAGELGKAVDMGAWMVDIELDSPSLQNVLSKARGKTKCMVSHHDWEGTPATDKLAEIVKAGQSQGAYACKIVTLARGFEDNIMVLKLFSMFPSVRLVAFAMGSAGIPSRVMAPLAGAYFTYASISGTQSSAPGQVSVQAMRAIYGMIK